MILARHLYVRMMRKGRVIGLLALASVPGLVYVLSAFDANEFELEALYSDIISTVGFSFAIAALILTVATLREERDNGTLPYIYMRPVSRTSLALSSMGAGIAAGLTIAFGGWMATVLAALAVGTDLAVVMPGLILFGVASVGYAAIFVPLGYLVPRSLLVGLGYVVVIESIVSNVVTGLAQLSIWRIAISVYADLDRTVGSAANELLGPVEAGVGGGLLKIGAVLLVGVVVLTWALRRRDAL